MTNIPATTCGHNLFPPQQIPAPSQSKVFVEGKPACITGDKTVGHTEVKPNPAYDPPSPVNGSTSKVFVTGVKAIQIGDKINCGDSVASGSSKVFIN